MSGFALLGGYIHEALLNLVSNELLGVQRFIVTGLLLLSGYAKLRDPIGAAVAMADFRIVRVVSRRWGLAAAGTELLIAVGLGVGNSLAALGAAVLLWSFVFLTARALRAGQTFACFCFGREDEPLSRGTVIRAALVAFAATAVLTASPASHSETTEQFVMQLAAASAVIGTAALAGTQQQLRSFLRHEHGEGATA